MVTAQTVKGLAVRLEKAQALVDAGVVFPVSGIDGYAVVRNGDGTQMYLVEHAEGRERCTCPDFQQRQKAVGLPCKHVLAAQLALGDRPQAPAPASAGLPDPRLGVLLLKGKRPDEALAIIAAEDAA